ncbi:MAG: chitobiase/beta-hexosaminidase C-terminal domain-containing protein [Thermodesulfobacteriota bacterium]
MDTTPPTTTASPTGGTYDSAQSVTLTCTDGSGSGCDKIYYTTDGTTPTTSSPVYASPINILVTTVLKFMAKDMGGTFETVQSQTYTISYGGCANPPVKIGSTFYLTLQAAYDAAGNGDTIRCRNVQLDENLTVNRNITVTLEGGYDCGYTTNYGATTPVKGSITTTSGGGTITIKNVTLEQ